MTASEAKRKIIFHYLTSGTSISAITEPALFNGYRADVLVLDNNFISTEIEIKVNREDLWSELRCIQKWKSILLPSYPTTKGSKHSYYLNQQFLDTNKLRVPNKFYFAVTEDLLEDAKKEIQGTPYGLIYLREAVGADLDPAVVVSGKRLHDNPVDKEFLIHNLRRMSWENYNLMGKVHELKHLNQLLEGKGKDGKHI
jgi:hypothetical protein